MSARPSPIRLVLASASPRRRELLAGLGLSFEVAVAGVEETPRPGESPPAYVERVATEKARAVARGDALAWVLAADTEVVVDGDILGKPRDAADAAAMLRRLSGRAHTVYSAIALAGARESTRVVATTVTFRPLSEAEVTWYVASGEPMDKAGAYAVQGKGGVLVRSVEGSVSNVIGLPLAETVELLAQAGFPLPWGAR
ncbi:MAG: Maf family protein [Myxococcota bacterium]